MEKLRVESRPENAEVTFTARSKSMRPSPQRRKRQLRKAKTNRPRMCRHFDNGIDPRASALFEPQTTLLRLTSFTLPETGMLKQNPMVNGSA